ncbi:MAG: ABC transporter ATP-binding protein [Tissierella sp.]|nr:ABC transporter ATP-binding protein [Tissierella sp.]
MKEKFEVFIKKYGFSYLVVIIFLISNIYLNSLAPRIIGNTFDALEVDGFNKDTILYYLGMLILVSIIGFITRFIWRYLIMGNSRKLECYLREELFKHLQTLPVEFYQERKTGDLLAYGINDISAVRMTFGPGLANITNSIGMSIIVVLSMSQAIHPKLTLYSLVPVPVIIYLMIKIGSLIRRRFTIVQENFAAISDRVQENISGIRVIKAYVQEKEEVEKFQILNDNMRESNIKMVRASSLLTPMMELCFGFSFMISLLYGSSLVKSNIISLGDFIAFNGYLTMIIRPIRSIGRVINISQRGMASYKRLDNIFKVKSDIVHNTGDPNLIDIHGDIEFRDLTFKYKNAEEPVLKNINLKIERGKTLGIIGDTGSGKTTLVDILLRLYNVDEGMVFIDGRDINDYSLSVLRENIGYVPQDNFLFSASIKDSINFSRDIYSDEEIEEATKLSLIYDNIVNFTHGFDTIVGERGVNLSGGQKQRLSIARAIIKQPNILIFDDALSAVDTKTEDKILDHFKEIMNGNTGIIIAHRISSIKDADEIAVMNHGQIIEKGNHEELLERRGHYFKIFKDQYKEEAEKVENEKS